jgi:undecaprenyl diphosphate synthase
MHLTIPKHIAIIMDGNGKWSKSKLLPKNIGHKKGANSAENVIIACKKLGVQYLTLYAFSSENWQRPKEEVEYLMELFKEYLEINLPKLIEQGIKVKFIGDRWRLSSRLQESMVKAEKSSVNGQFILIIAISYGARDEIRQAAVDFIKDIYTKKINLANLDRNDFDKYISTYDIPDPDLLIRTGGETRISNFMLWQLSYSELYFTSKLWPDFGENDLLEAIHNYSQRNRRYGR